MNDETEVRARRRPLALLGVAVAAVVVLSSGACNGDPPSGGASDEASAPSNDASAPSNETKVTIKDFAFKPDGLRVKAGTAVSVVNADDTPHTLTADDKSFDTGSLKGGASGSVTPAKAGKVGYFCEIHDYMKGTLEVG